MSNGQLFPTERLVGQGQIINRPLVNYFFWKLIISPIFSIVVEFLKKKFVSKKKIHFYTIFSNNQGTGPPTASFVSPTDNAIKFDIYGTICLTKGDGYNLSQITLDAYKV